MRRPSSVSILTTLAIGLMLPACLNAAPAGVSLRHHEPAATAYSPSSPAQAYTPADSRVRVVDFVDGEIIPLYGCLKFQTMITFATSEHIENVGVGDSSQWQVMPNKRADLLFVKPLVEKAFSNMTVVSDKRSYNFELKTAPDADCARGRVVYELRFRYAPDPVTAPTTPVGVEPADPNAGLPVPEKRNTAYTYSGDTDLVPLRVFDDGSSTYLKWATGIAAPAVYALNSDNTESLINFANHGDYFVVEQVARAFVLRRGSEKATLYNDNFVVQGLDALSPQPHDGHHTSGGK